MLQETMTRNMGNEITGTKIAESQECGDETLAIRLAERGFIVLPEFLPPAEVAALRGELLALRAAGAFRPATVSRQQRLAPTIRSDLIHWIEEDEAGEATRAWFLRLERLRRTLNRVAFLGLMELEAHFAIYEPGARYARHLDRFRDNARRVVTAILYLNEDWRPEDGGALRLWLDEAGREESIDVLPAGGTLVLFLSGRFWHEVLPARRARLSLTGWFLARP